MVETNIPCEVGSKQIPVNVTLEVDLALNFRQHSLLQPGNPRTVPQLRCQSPSSGSYRGPTLPIRGREDVHNHRHSGESRNPEGKGNGEAPQFRALKGWGGCCVVWVLR